MSANDKQIGGTHYAEGGDIQHWDWVIINGMGYLEGVASKYVARYRKKNGRQDLEKALHYVQKLQEAFAAGHVSPRGQFADKKLTTRQFAERNGLNAAEEVTCKLLATWRGRSDLVQIELLVKNLIAKLG